MKSTTALKFFAVAALFAASSASHAFSGMAGGGQQPATTAGEAAPASPISMGPGAKPATRIGKDGVTTVTLLDWETQQPKSWKELTPSSSMRLAQYQVPGEKQGEEGELVVFYFGEGSGGAPEININRWQTQFSSPDGKEVTPRIEKLQVSGMNVTIAEFNGSYARAIGVGPGGTPKPGQTLLAAVVETTKGNLTFQLHGPQATVKAHQEEFMAFIKGLKPAAK